MNPEKSSREEIEARLTTLLLGELPAEEAALLRRTISQDPALKKLHDELQSTIVLVREAKKNPAAAPEDSAPLKLSDERRQKLLAHFKTPRPQESFWIRRLEIPSMSTLMIGALVIVLVVGIAALSIPNFVKARSTSPANAVINNLRQIDAAKNQWALENNKSADAVPTPEDLKPYLAKGIPPSITGETYVLGKVSEPVIAEADTIQAKKALGNVALKLPAGGALVTYSPAPAVMPATPVPPAVTLAPEPILAPPPTAIVLPSAESPATTTTGSLADSGNGAVFSQRIIGYGAAPNSLNASATPSAELLAFQTTNALPTAGSIIAFDDESGTRSVGGGFGGGGGYSGTTFSSRRILATRARNENRPAGAGGESNNFGLQDIALTPPPETEPALTVTEKSFPPSFTDRKPKTANVDQFDTDGLQNGLAAANSDDMPRHQFSRNKTDKSDGEKVPLAGDVPVMGNLFQGAVALGSPAPTSSPTIPLDADSRANSVAKDSQNRGQETTIDPATGLPAAPVAGESKLEGKESNKSIPVVGIVSASAGAGGFRSSGQSGGGGGGGGLNYTTQLTPSSQVSAQTRAYISSLGVDLNVPGKAVFYNDRSGLLFVKASKRDLDTIEHSLMAAPSSFADAIGLNSGMSAVSTGGEKSSNIDENGLLVRTFKFESGTNATALTTVEVDRPVQKPSEPAPVPQPEILTSENAFSTFSLNVSDVSFQLAAASLEQGRMPDATTIRSEEFINAFDYRDPEAVAGQPMAFTAERARYPFAQNRDLLRFSIKTAAVGRPAGRALNIVLLLDVSGSMERADRVAIIHEALRVLAGQLQPLDTVSVVTFARTARLWADGIAGDKAGETLDKVGGITPEGGTNLEEALRLAYETARRHYLANGLNRVVLLTDGAANLGNVDPAVLKQKVEAQRRQGIALDCFGIGFDGYDDDLMEQLSRNGDGRYAFINSPDDAGKEFAAKLAGALQVAASDVKVQVEFNPERVISYRQIGYARHQLTKAQFRDNSVLAAEIAAQEAGNALYTIQTKPDGTGPIATVRVRYKVPGTADYEERSWQVDYAGNAPALEQSGAAMRLAATTGAFSEWLAASPFAQEVTPDALLNILGGVPEIYGADGRPKKLEWMIRQAKSLSGK